MLQAINNLEKVCSAKYSLMKCERPLRALILTHQGDVFGYCNAHFELLKRAIVKRGYTIHSYLQKDVDITPFVPTGPKKPEDTAAEADRNLRQAIELTNAVGDQNLRLIEAVETYRWVMGQLIEEFALEKLTPDQPCQVLAEVVGRSRMLLAERLAEREELVALHRELQETRERAALHEATANELRQLG